MRDDCFSSLSKPSLARPTWPGIPGMDPAPPAPAILVQHPCVRSSPRVLRAILKRAALHRAAVHIARFWQPARP